jgi:hypothetical protein
MNERVVIDEMKKYPLSNTDIQSLLDGETNIFTYPMLDDIDHIDEVFDSKGRAIMLFLTDGENSGHWISVIKRGTDIEVYDPYGHSPAEWKTKLGGAMSDMKRWIQDKPLLEKKVRDAGYRLIYNKKQVQPISKNIATCGRHSVMRLLFHHYPIDEYNAILKKIQNETGISPDDLATGLTGESLGK